MLTANHMQVELVSETPDWLRLSVAGLADPLQISYWRREDILRVKVGCSAALQCWLGAEHRGAWDGCWFTTCLSSVHDFSASLLCM